MLFFLYLNRRITSEILELGIKVAPQVKTQTKGRKMMSNRNKREASI